MSLYHLNNVFSNIYVLNVMRFLKRVTFCCILFFLFVFSSAFAANQNEAKIIFIAKNTCISGLENIYINGNTIAAAQLKQNTENLLNINRENRHLRIYTPLIEFLQDGDNTPFAFFTAADDAATITQTNNNQRDRKSLYNNLIFNALFNKNKIIIYCRNATHYVSTIRHNPVTCGFLTAFAPNSPPNKQKISNAQIGHC